jgi:tetratricopeptide (TPR) repeat protein
VQRAITVIPDPAFTAAYDEALAHLKKREHEQAVAKFTEALRCDPKSPNAHLGRALAHRSLGDEASATRDEVAAKELGGAEGSTWARLVNRAYQLWKTNSQASRAEFYQGLPPLQRQAVQLWELNSQVMNGGFPQWLVNGYGAGIDDVIETAKQIGTIAALELQSILEGVRLHVSAQCTTEDESNRQQGELLRYTDCYYRIAPQFAKNAESWLDEQLRR